MSRKSEVEAVAEAVQVEPVRERERMPGDRSAAPPMRDGDPKIYLAELRRGISYRLEQSPATLVFEFGIKVPVSAKEMTYLQHEAVDRIEYQDLGPDGLGHTSKLVQKFRFFDAESGEQLPDAEVEMPEPVEGESLDAYERYNRAMARQEVRRANR